MFNHGNSNDDPAYKKLKEEKEEKEEKKGSKTPSAPPVPPGALSQGLTGIECDYKEDDENSGGEDLGPKKQKQKQKPKPKPKLTQKSKKSAIPTNTSNLAPLIKAIKKLDASGGGSSFKCNKKEFKFIQIPDEDGNFACMIAWCKELGSDEKQAQQTQVTITSTCVSGGSNIEENLEAILVANQLIASGDNGKNKAEFLQIDWDDAKKKGQIESMRIYLDKIAATADEDLKNMAIDIKTDLRKYESLSNLKQDSSDIQVQNGASAPAFISPMGGGKKPDDSNMSVDSII